MDAPKPGSPSSKAAPEGLAEVERALSVLQGRHPEHERARREDAERQAARRASMAAIEEVEVGRTRRRRALVVGAALGIVTVVGAVALLISHALSRRARLEHAAAPFASSGFTLVEAGAGTLDATVPPGCVLASGDGEVRLRHPAGVVAGPGPLLACFCESTPLALSAGGDVVLLRAEASAIGGSKAFALLDATAIAARTRAVTDAACAEASFDAWLAAKSWRSPAGGEAPPALRTAGFTPLARTSTVAVVDVPAASCLLVRGPGANLRLAGGAPAVRRGEGDAAWCTATAATVTIEASAPTTALVAPAARIGGLGGLAEIAPVARAAPTDYAWDAKQLLVASAIGEGLVGTATAPDFGADADARIVATSSEVAGTIGSETADGVYSYCAGTLCAFSGPQKWRINGTTEGGIARAKLPFWLVGLQGVSEPSGLQAIVQLLVLARRLHREGFEPTTIEAMTETDRGLEVLGRAKEDAIVAVTLLKSAPWVVGYTDGPPWRLDGDPRTVPLAALQRVQLTAGKAKLPPKATRHSVVFRRKSL